jgi:hypothetical protein
MPLHIQQVQDGETLFPSKVLLDLARCFQPVHAIDPGRLIQSTFAMNDAFPFLKKKYLIDQIVGSLKGRDAGNPC